MLTSLSLVVSVSRFTTEYNLHLKCDHPSSASTQASSNGGTLRILKTPPKRNSLATGSTTDQSIIQKGTCILPWRESIAWAIPIPMANSPPRTISHLQSLTSSKWTLVCLQSSQWQRQIFRRTGQLSQVSHWVLTKTARGLKSNSNNAGQPLLRERFHRTTINGGLFAKKLQRTTRLWKRTPIGGVRIWGHLGERLEKTQAINTTFYVMKKAASTRRSSKANPAPRNHLGTLRPLTTDFPKNLGRQMHSNGTASPKKATGRRS